MKTKKLNFIVIVSIIAVIVVINCFYILSEGYQVIITQFGKPIGRPVTEAGLHLKLPFIQKVTTFEKRILEWDGDPNQIPTKDKKYISVDTTARWKIKDALKFFQSVNDERGGHGRLDDIVDAAVRDAVTSHNLIEMVRSTNRLITELERLEEEKEFVEESAFEKVTLGRDKLRGEILERAKELAPQYGIELIDVRIKRVNYVEEVRLKVYERMIAERKRAAEQYRSEGRGTRAEIEGQTEKELKGILSQAYKTSQEIKGEADAKSTKIYADAYNKDPDFFTFRKTLETYKSTVDTDTTLILTTDSDYFKYLKDISPNR
ncbi:MAG: protease modulator HflC [Candidatus Omnitrophota bacterium]|nr:MAG: protease modulator HflC [Candidatus Omnitrophota bacterium]